MLGQEGTINLPPNGVRDIAQFRFLPRTMAICSAVLIPAVLFGLQLLNHRRRKAAELEVRPLWQPLAVDLLLAVLLQIIVAKLYQDRGIPWTFVFMVAVVAVVDWMCGTPSTGAKSLRGREHRSCPASGHQRQLDPHLGVHVVQHACRDRRCDRGDAARLRQPAVRWR